MGDREFEAVSPERRLADAGVSLDLEHVGERRVLHEVSKDFGLSFPPDHSAGRTHPVSFLHPWREPLHPHPEAVRVKGRFRPSDIGPGPAPHLDGVRWKEPRRPRGIPLGRESIHRLQRTLSH